MLLSQPVEESKQRRACTPESHKAVANDEKLFQALTTPCGFQDWRQKEGMGVGIVELGLCKNCGDPLARQLTPEQETMWCLATGEM